VTWPTSSVDIARVLDARISAAVTSRIWAGPPGALSNWPEAMVCTESSTSSAGLTCSMWPSTAARSVSAAR